MNSIEARRSRVLVAAIALAVAALAYLVAQSEVDRSEASAKAPAGRSSQAGAVEAHIARVDLAGTMEDAMGSEFAGIWFEPSTARVRAGFTSPAGRRVVEAVAAQTDLTGVVIPTPARSTWAQLEAAQDRWGRRLEDLFDQAKVATALDPERNAVTIALGSSVSRARRAALERRAAAASVNVLISTVPSGHLRVTQHLRCAALVVKEAACERPIVAGVSIMGSQVKKSEIEEGEEGEEDVKDLEFVEEGEVEGELVGRGRCTAGPAVIVEKPADQATATKTYILTAGHCIDKKWGGGDVGKKWAAYNKKAPPEEKEVGPATAFLNAATDVGVIEVTTAYWATANDPIPVTPAVAIWDAGKETEPLPVIAKNTPMLNTTSCLSGQVSGTSCGEIITLDQKITVKKITTENLIEVKGVTETKGDSGAPWFSEAQYKKGFGYMEGVHVGTKGATGNGVYQSLDTSFAELKKLKNLDLKLLTQANERRHAVFKADKYPQTVTTGAGGEDLLTAFGLGTKCTEKSFDGAITEPKVVEGKETNALEVTPTYAGCTTNSLPTTIVNNSCKYKLTLQEKLAAGQYKATMDVVCPEGKAGIEIFTYTNKANHESGTWLCKLTVPPQTGLKSVTLTNSGGDIVLDKATVEGIKVKIHRKGILCPSSGTENETTAGAYDIGPSWTFAGTSEGKEVNIEMIGS